jgi:hypothetical protein
MRPRTELMAIPIVAVVLGILFLVMLTAEVGCGAGSSSASGRS